MKRPVRPDGPRDGLTFHKTNRRVTEEEVERLKSNLALTPEEEAAVELAVSRTLKIREECATGNDINAFHSPKGMPTADAAIDSICAPWRRRASLLDLVIVIAAHRTGVPLGLKSSA